MKVLIGPKFSTLKKSSSRIRSLKHCAINQVSGKAFLFQLNNKLINDLVAALNFVSVASLNKNSLKHIAHLINDKPFRLLCQYKYVQWCFAV